MWMDGGEGEVAADSVGGGWVVRWRQRCSREVFTLRGPWGRSCEVCCAERDFERLASGIPVALGGERGSREP